MEQLSTIGRHTAGLGGVFMLAPDTIQAGSTLGLDLAAFYGLGRAGVLGDAPAEVVQAEMFFFPRELVIPAWNRAREVMGPAEAVVHYAEACRNWGRAHYAGVPGMARICELGEKVIAATDPSGRALFAGWARIDLPDDTEGRAAQVLHVLREGRGALHVAAVIANGLTPLQALLANSGPDEAALFGWPGPYPDPAPFVAAHTAAGTLTDQLAAADFAVLSTAEREELAALLDHVVTVVAPR